MDRPTFSQSLETQQLVKLLADESHDDTFTYDELSKACGVNVRERRGPVASAVRTLQRDKGIVFETVRGVGIRRASDSSIIKARSSDMSHIRNTARRGLKKLACVRDFKSLPPESQQQHNVMASSLGILYHVTTPNAQKKLENKIEEAKRELPVAETLAALGFAK